MPMPVSRTLNVSQAPRSSVSRATRSHTVPPSVNLHAFDSRFSRLCRSFISSARTAVMPEATSTCKRLPFFSASGWATAATASTMPGTSTSVSESSILPASIFDRSSTVLISSSRWWPAARILPRSPSSAPAPTSVASSARSSL